jgi:hypothetical protein
MNMQTIDRPKFQEIEPPEPPPVILHNWILLMNGCLWGDVENHPTLGNAKDVRTSKVQYMDEMLGIARTRNTTYILRNKKEIQ